MLPAVAACQHGCCCCCQPCHAMPRCHAAMIDYLMPPCRCRRHAAMRCCFQPWQRWWWFSLWWLCHAACFSRCRMLIIFRQPRLRHAIIFSALRLQWYATPHATPDWCRHAFCRHYWFSLLIFIIVIWIISDYYLIIIGDILILLLCLFIFIINNYCIYSLFSKHIINRLIHYHW